MRKRRFLGFFRLVVVLALPALLLAACDRVDQARFDTQSALGSVGFADRCADFMRRAFPETRLDIVNRQVSVDSNIATAAITAERRNVPADGAFARQIGAECRFDNTILIGFRWTSGPIRSAIAGEAR